MRPSLIVSFVAALVAAPLRPAAADEPFGHDESPYALRLDVDIATVILGGVLWGGTSFIGATTQPPFCGGSTTPACDPSAINAFDRLAIGHSSAAARTAADVISFVPIAYLALDMIDVGPKNWKTYLTDLWVVAEALAWNGAVQDIVRRAVRRPRPFLYTAGVYPSERDSPEAGFSFYSGHTSFAFALATSCSYTFALRHPHSKWRWVVWPALMAMRVDRAGLARLLRRPLPDRRARRRGRRLGLRLALPRAAPPPQVRAQDPDRNAPAAAVLARADRTFARRQLLTIGYTTHITQKKCAVIPSYSPLFVGTGNPISLISHCGFTGVISLRAMQYYRTRGRKRNARLARSPRKLRISSEPRLAPLEPRRDTWTARLVRWHSAAPKPGESVRWESLDGRWVAISLGEGDELGCAVVAGAEGRRTVVDTYEQALVVAETWRT